MYALSLLSVEQRRKQKAVRAASVGGFNQSLRYYFAGDIKPGLFPHQLNGRETITITEINPSSVSLR